MARKILTHRGKLLLFLIAALTAFLTCYRLTDAGNGNAYYTAAVKSMLSGWHNFFYASFDNGFISVDKPALGLWLQCLFALVFGLHGWSVILPEALCSVGSVIVLFVIVKRPFGERCALLASFFLSITPIFVAASRTNNLDASLTFVCLLAMLALLKAAEKGSLKLLLLSAALIGVGFNIKMLQAFMFLPAFYLVYFFSADSRCGKRIIHLAAATAVLAAVSLSWCLIVDLTPAAARPYVGGSTTNSTLELAIGYNGLLRALPIDSAALREISGTIAIVPNEGGHAGVLRFFNAEMFGQASWLLPMSLLGLIVLVTKLAEARVNAETHKPLRSQALLWFGLFLPMFVYFCISDHLHRYYLIMFAPCLAALAAVAVAVPTSWASRGETAGKTRQLPLLPVGLMATAAVQAVMLLQLYQEVGKTLVSVIIALEALAVILYILGRQFGKQRTLAVIAAMAAVAGISAAPLYWAYTPIRYGGNAVAPFAGPELFRSGLGGPWGGSWFSGGEEQGGLVPQGIVDYVLAHDNGSRFLISVPSAMYAAPIILNTGASVMTRGGFTGFDRPMTLEQFEKLIHDGDVQFCYLSDFYMGNEITRFIKTQGKKVDPSAYGESPMFAWGHALYDMSGLKTG